MSCAFSGRASSPAVRIVMSMSEWRARRSATALAAITLVGVCYSATASDATATDATTLDTIVVTGRRAESNRSETPQKIEVIDRDDLNRTLARDLTDMLKKNSSVDVIQFNGVLSGIGMRGFRPEFEFAINKRSLLLVDGRPAGSTNLGTLLLDNVERIEVQKGPASALYGASAMGGVVNIITQRPRGDSAGEFAVGYGSYDSRELTARAGGALGTSAYYAVTARRFDQNDDYKTGDDVRRPFTRFETDHATARLGYDLSSSWTIEGTGELHRDHDVLTPGSDQTAGALRGSKDLDRRAVDLRFRGDLGRHQPVVVAYFANERADLERVDGATAAERALVPYRNFASDIDYAGLQLRDEWAWSDSHRLVVGLDYDATRSESRSFGVSADGTRIQEQLAFFRDNERRTAAVFVQSSLRFNEARTVLEAGARFDRIEVETFATPLAPTFQPSTTSVERVTPSIGFKQELRPGWRLHGTAGRGFVVPEAGQLTGFNRQRVGDRDRITQGNPDLSFESSDTWDVGVEWSGRSAFVDLTYFDTTVDDRITSVTVFTPPPGAPPQQAVIDSFTNANDAAIRGLELDAQWNVSASTRLFLNWNHYLDRRETVGGVERTIFNVAESTVRGGIDVDYGPLSGRLSARYVGERIAQDFNQNPVAVVAYPDFVTVDLGLTYRWSRHRLSVDLANLFDESYFEVLGYTLAGRNVMARYRYSL